MLHFGLCWRGFLEMFVNFQTGSITTSNLYAQLFLTSENGLFEVEGISNRILVFADVDFRKYSSDFENFQKPCKISPLNSSWARRTVDLKIAIILDQYRMSISFFSTIFDQKWRQKYQGNQANPFSNRPNFKWTVLEEYLSDSNNFWCVGKLRV